MAKPVKPTWAYGDPSYAIQPSAGKQSTGWLPAEKPPYQYMNWIHLRSGEWFTYLEDKAETISPTMIRSAASATWNGSTLTFAQPIEISFRVTTTEQINRIGAADSPLALADGQVLVFIKDKTNASPVTLTAGSYATLIAGQYVVLNESALTALHHENEVILFRRRGTDLEIPVLGQVFPTGAVITFGQSYVGLGSLASAGFLMPIGSIVPFYDYNGALTFDPAYWSYCDGSVVTINGTPRTTPDLSGRYLVGFGADGGGDIDTAVWATAAVGLAGNIINLQHNHTVNSHSHTGPSHTHGLGSHTHTLTAELDHSHTGLTDVISNNSGFSGSQIAVMDDDGVIKTTHHFAIDSGVNNFEGQHRHGIIDDGGHNHGGATGAASGNTAADGTGATSSETPGTDNQLSTTQSIQPRSIRVRYLIRTN